MSDDVVIRAERLGKKYMIGHHAERERYTALRDVVARSAKGLRRKAHDVMRGRALLAGDTVEEFWALKDVNFEVKRGEVLGIIGRNGAGKSTLLKILSRITEPSEGRVSIKGRVASLLEVGTGFHPELTGRENIYLNGAILGMSRAEIRRKFDDIVAFAEVEKFLDTPVKRYSSGMYVRLAFAVAAHLDPEILVVDEVLAVGDTEFQKKCLGRMKAVAGEGRTVLFVSHNLTAMSSLCDTGVVLTKGRAATKCPIDESIRAYRAQIDVAPSGEVRQWTDRVSNHQATIISFRITEADNDAVHGQIPLDVPIRFQFEIEFNEPVQSPSFGVLVHDALGEVLLDLRSSNYQKMDYLCNVGTKCMEAIVHHPALLPGDYLVSFWINNFRETVDIDLVRMCGSFRIIDPAASQRRGSLRRSGAKVWAAAEWRLCSAGSSVVIPHQVTN